jgi:PAS domain S-box-containing protein
MDTMCAKASRDLVGARPKAVERASAPFLSRAETAVDRTSGLRCGKELSWTKDRYETATEQGYRVNPGAGPLRFVMPPSRRQLSPGLREGSAPTDAIDEFESRFFMTAHDLLCCLDFNGHFKRLNPAWERTLGFTIEELCSRPFIEFVHPDDRERTLGRNAEVRAGDLGLGFENRYLAKDGSYRWLDWNATPDVVGRIIYSVARDVTESKRAAAEREHLLRDLQSALAEVEALRGILPMCSYCRRIRDREDSWHSMEEYIHRHTESRFSHGICPSCVEKEIDPRFQSDRKPTR